MKQLTDFFEEKQVNRILDVGTGTGDFLKVLKNVFPLAQITGVDPLAESLEEAKKNFPGVVFHRMTAEKLDFGDGQFDVVSISMALHHLPDIQAAFHEMKRVLKPGGWLIVNELVSDGLNPAQEVHKMLHHFRSKIDRLTGEVHNETFTRVQILEMVKNAGIEIILQFEDNRGKTDSPEELELRYAKVAAHLEKIKDRPEYDLLKAQAETFRIKMTEYGFQPAPRIVVVGRAL